MAFHIFRKREFRILSAIMSILISIMAISIIDTEYITRGTIIYPPDGTAPYRIRFGGTGFMLQYQDTYAYANEFNRTVFIHDDVIPTSYLLAHEFKHLKQFDSAATHDIDWDNDVMEDHAHEYGCAHSEDPYWKWLSANILEMTGHQYFSDELYAVNCDEELVITNEIN